MSDSYQAIYDAVRSRISGGNSVIQGASKQQPRPSLSAQPPFVPAPFRSRPMTALETARGLSEAQRAAIAEAVHRGRFPADREPTPFADEDARGREYCFRIADQVLALPPSGIAEAWQPIETAPKDGTRFVAATADGALDFARWHRDHVCGDNDGIAPFVVWHQLGALDLSNLGDGE